MCTCIRYVKCFGIGMDVILHMSIINIYKLKNARQYLVYKKVYIYIYILYPTITLINLYTCIPKSNVCMYTCFTDQDTVRDGTILEYGN